MATERNFSPMSLFVLDTCLGGWRKLPSSQSPDALLRLKRSLRFLPEQRVSVHDRCPVVKRKGNRQFWVPLLIVLSSLAHADDASYCQGLSPLMQAALGALPPDLKISCDADHIVEIPDMDQFLTRYFYSHPSASQNPESDVFKEALRTAYAFVLDLQYPIYVNSGRYKNEREGYINGNTWLAYAIAPLLAHEQVHARGERRESRAYAVELQTATRFIDRGDLPREGYDMKRLRAVIDMEKQAEKPH